MKTVEDKAIEAYEENQKQKRKYQIEDEAWGDWFAEGYYRAEKDIKKLISNDTQAAAFQTTGQYRSWLLEKLS